MDFRIVRLEFQCTLETGQRLLRPVERLQNNASVRMRGRLAGIDRDGLVDECECRFVPALLVLKHSQQVQGIEMPGYSRENFAVDGFSLGQMPFLVERYCLLQVGRA